jgi:hypothetical protein
MPGFTGEHFGGGHRLVFRADVGDKARRLVASTRPLLGESAHSQTAAVVRRSMYFACLTPSSLDLSGRWGPLKAIGLFWCADGNTRVKKAKSTDARPTWYLGKIACVFTSPRLNPRLPAQLTAGLVQECLKQSLHSAPPERVSARLKVSRYIAGLSRYLLVSFLLFSVFALPR